MSPKIRTLTLFAALLAVVPAWARTSTLRVADFDGDGRPDCATLRLQDRIDGPYRYRVNIALSGGPESSFQFSSAQARFGLQVAAVDVDGDRDLDLVIRSAFDFRLIAVWINDGHGAFTEGRLTDYPQAVGVEHDQVAESGYHPRTAAGLPRVDGPGAFSERISQRSPAPDSTNRKLSSIPSPRNTIGRDSTPMRGPPPPSLHNS